MNVKELIGKRVRLIQGMNPPNEDVMIWIAGTILVGSTGTVALETHPFEHVVIRWDNPDYKPRKGYSFMIASDRGLEILEDNHEQE